MINLRISAQNELPKFIIARELINQICSRICFDVTIEKSGNLDVLDKVQFEISYKDIVQKCFRRKSFKRNTEKINKKELEEYGVITKFEFGIYSNGIATNVKSPDFKYDKELTYSIPVILIMRE
jgi:hypothetical protein